MIKILHLCNSMLAGAPVHLSNCLNKYSGGDICSLTVVKQKFTNSILNNLDWAYDFVAPDNSLLLNLIRESDIIHFHGKPYQNGMDFSNKKTILQFHSQPEHHGVSYVNRDMYKTFNGRKLCINQYHTRCYDFDYKVPNMIDIWDKRFIPSKNETNSKLNIFFGYASEAPGWGYKGVKEVTEVLQKLKDIIDFNIVTNTSYDNMLSIKTKSDIVISDCNTGSFHLTDLEGLSLKCAVINNVDDLTTKNIIELTGVKDNPYIKSSLQNLEKIIIQLSNSNKKDIKDLQDYGRSWMEMYWNPKNLINIYHDIYKKVIRS